MSVSPDDWLDAYGDVLFRYAVKHARDADLAADLVQETFLAAWTSRDRFDGRSSEQTWLIGILRHKMLDAFRHRRRERVADDFEQFMQSAEGDDDGDYVGNHIRAQGSWGRDPETALESDAFWHAFQACLDGLPEPMAQVFLMRQFEGVDTAECCKTLDVSETNLYVILYRARQRLRSCLRARWFAPAEAPDVL